MMVHSVVSGFILFVATLALAQAQVTVKVQLRPAGSFEIKTPEIKGHALQKANQVSASNIVVSLKNLKTGIDLRDEHTRKYLEVDKYPDAVLLSATGSSGSGQGKIKIKGITKDISGTYKISNGFLEAEFPLKLADFNITGVRYMSVGVKEEIRLKVTVPIKQ